MNGGIRPKLLAIRMALWKSVAIAEVLPAHKVMTVEVFSDLQAAIGQTARLDPGPWQPPVRAMNKHNRSLRDCSINAAICWVTAHPVIPRNNEADHQAPAAHEDWGYAVCEGIYTSPVDTARWISDGGMLAKAMWDAEQCSKHHGYWLKGKAWSKRSLPMMSLKWLARRF